MNLWLVSLLVRVVITGGAGFIGSNLCRHLISNGSYEVVVLDDLSTGSRENIMGLDVELVEGSILDRETVDRCLVGADAVVHLAALGSVPRSIADPRASHRANTDGTFEVLEGCRRHGRPHLVVASSSSVYGANPELPKHERLATRPMSPYAATKLATEAYALAWAHSFELPVLAFRFFNVFGPGQPAGHAYAAVVPAFIHAALTKRAIPVYGDGRQSRDFTYVGTVCDVIVSALERRVTSSEPVNLAYGGRITLLELIARIESSLGEPVVVEHHPRRRGDVTHSQAESTALLSMFADVPPTPIDEGLQETISWMRAWLASR